MFQRIIDDFRERTGAALRLTSLAGLTLLALLITAAFLLAAGFIYVLQEYGPIQACLAGAGVFFVVTLIAAGCYVGRKIGRKSGRQKRRGPQLQLNPRWSIPC